MKHLARFALGAAVFAGIGGAIAAVVVWTVPFMVWAVALSAYLLGFALLED